MSEGGRHGLVTVEATAKRLTVSVSAIRRLIRAGFLPYKRITPHSIRVPLEAIEQWLLKCTDKLEGLADASAAAPPSGGDRSTATPVATTPSGRSGRKPSGSGKK